MDPLGNMPIFLTVLKDVPAEKRKQIILRELIIALIVLLFFYSSAGLFWKFLI
jgi:multiple antibiotic resistance protein